MPLPAVPHYNTSYLLGVELSVLVSILSPFTPWSTNSAFFNAAAASQFVKITKAQHPEASIRQKEGRRKERHEDVMCLESPGHFLPASCNLANQN